MESKCTTFDPERIRELLEHQGRSQEWLAEQIDYTPDHLSRCLTGKHPISAKMASAIANLLGVPLHWLLEKEAAAA